MRYPIGRISKLLGLSTETIRTYERKGSSIRRKMKTATAPSTFWISARCCAAVPIPASAFPCRRPPTPSTATAWPKRTRCSSSRKNGSKNKTDYNLRMLNRLNDLNEVMSTCEREINRLSVVQHPGMFRVVIATTTSCFPATRGKICWRCGRPLRRFPLSAEISAGIHSALPSRIISAATAFWKRMRATAACAWTSWSSAFPLRRRSHHPQGGWGRFRSDSYAHPASDFARENRARPHGGRVYAHGGHHQAKRAGL